MKITIVTATFNSAATVEDTLRSVAAQDHPDIEHIIVDGGSTDGTLEIVARHPHVSRVISEPDEGLYDAMNKGLAIATGDAVGFLNSDDFFCVKDAVSTMVSALEGVDAAAADVVFVDRDDVSRVRRVQRTRHYKRWMLRVGNMPPHPTLYIRTGILRRIGHFDNGFRIAGDFELCVRLLLGAKASIRFVPRILVGFRIGGVSTMGIGSTVTINREIQRALASNGIGVSLSRLYLRYALKCFQYVRRAREYQVPAWVSPAERVANCDIGL